MIRRRAFLQSAVAGGLAAPYLTAAGKTRPNFLFLIADDLTFRAIHSLNNPEVETPNLDRLVTRGCTFTHCFHQGSWSGAVCIASRTMLNTGLTAFRARERVDRTPLWGQTLGEAGYNTHIVGKWHLSPANLKRNFQTTGPVSGGMFESGPEAYDRPKPGNTWTPWDQSLKGQWLRTAQWEPKAQREIKHSAEIWADFASDYLLARPRQANPFFLYVAFNSPHDPRQAPKEYVDRYPADRIQVPPNYLPEHPFDEGDHLIRDEKLAPFPRTREAVRVHRSEYYAHTTYMDAQIGRILEALEKSGRSGHTYVIFTADHGLAVGQHGLMGKQNLYDHSIRMPLSIAGPGIRPGRRVDHLVYQHSMFATTCELAGVPIPEPVEFPSLAGVLWGRAGEMHDAVFSRYLEYQRAVRTKRYKLIVYPKAGVTQLFDMQKDPWEITNLAAKPKLAGVRQQLLARLHRFQKDLGDDLPAVEITAPTAPSPSRL
ncbi:MAG: sulfatase-like hydrolase/transferase [Terriglobia bacterium]